MKESLSRKVFNVVNVTIILFLCITMVYPFLNQLAIALNESVDTMQGGITIFPRVPTLENFRKVFANDQIADAALITISVTIISTILVIMVTFAAAYALSDKELRWRKNINLFLSIPMYISAGTIPIYMTMRYLGLINNYLVYILPGLFSFYNMLVIRSYIEGLPASLEEAAKIDGANDFVVMSKVIFPLCKPVIATVTLWVAVARWNDWTTTMYYITEPKLYTLQYVMMQLIKQAEAATKIATEEGSALMDENQIMVSSQSIQSATLLIITLPILCSYPFLQKYFIGGVTLGAVKG